LNTSRRLAYAALLVAFGLTGAYAESIPNFESLTLVAFCSGVLLGARDGAMVGAMTMTLYTLLNPYGPAPPLVMLAQVLGNGLSGAGGALFARLSGPRWPVAARSLGLVTSAVFLTALYDLMTNVATGLVFGQMRTWLVAGIPFSLWHIAFNAVLFVVLGTPLTAVLARYGQRLSASYSSPA
jgi:ABC-type Fe3+-siderophore transport system permease subunit